MMRPSSDPATIKQATNIAFINNHIEHHNASTKIQGIYDHFLLWHNTMPTMWWAVYKDTGRGHYSMKNVSMIGNYIREWQNGEQTLGWQVFNDTAAIYGNETRYNHYEYSVDDGCPGTMQYFTHSPDTGNTSANTVCQDHLDANHRLTSGSSLIGLVSNPVIFYDRDNKYRGTAADVGAYEYSVSPLMAPTGLRLNK